MQTALDHDPRYPGLRAGSEGRTVDRSAGIARDRVCAISAGARRRANRANASRRLIALALLLSVGAVAAGAPAGVELFSPQGTVKAVRQVAVRFSQPMVAFGDPRLPEPFVIDCPAAGHARWADARNWVYDFATDLDAGIACHFTLRSDLRSLAGAAVAATSAFSFDTGGPAVRAAIPAEGDNDIDADQAFILGLDAAVDSATVTAHGACLIANVAERIPLEIITGAARATLLAQRRQLGYQYFSILWKSGRQSVEKVTREDLERAEEQLLVVRCRRQLPPATAVHLVWGAGIATPGGIANAVDQVLAFRTRPAFNVRIECDRVNARAQCLPLLSLRIVFGAPVATAQAQTVRVTGDDGTVYATQPPAANAPTVDELVAP